MTTTRKSTASKSAPAKPPAAPAPTAPEVVHYVTTNAGGDTVSGRGLVIETTDDGDYVIANLDLITVPADAITEAG